MQHFAGVRPEAHHGGDAAIGFTAHGLDHAAMAGMQAVKAAERQGRGGAGLLW